MTTGSRRRAPSQASYKRENSRSRPTIRSGSKRFSPASGGGSLGLATHWRLAKAAFARTAEYDRGDKLAHYKLIPSLKEVVFVAHDARRVTVVRREGDAWTTHEASDDETVALTSLGCELAVAEVYRDDTIGP